VHTTATKLRLICRSSLNRIEKWLPQTFEMKSPGDLEEARVGIVKRAGQGVESKKAGILGFQRIGTQTTAEQLALEQQRHVMASDVPVQAAVEDAHEMARFDYQAGFFPDLLDDHFGRQVADVVPSRRIPPSSVRALHEQ